MSDNSYYSYYSYVQGGLTPTIIGGLTPTIIGGLTPTIIGGLTPTIIGGFDSVYNKQKSIGQQNEEKILSCLLDAGKSTSELVKITGLHKRYHIYTI